MNNLVDSSAWVEYFRGNPKFSFISELISVNSVCTNDVILAEILPSIVHKNEHRLAELLNCVKKIPLSVDWPEVRNIQLLNLRHGNDNIGLSDIVVAQNCMQNDLMIIVHNRYFKAMAGYIPLRIYGSGG